MVAPRRPLSARTLLAAALAPLGACGGGGGGAGEVGEPPAPAAVLGNLHYAPSEVMAPLSEIRSPEGHGSAAFVGGHLLVLYSSDGGGTDQDGGIEMWDLTDPRAPVLAARHDDADTHGLREAHGFGLARSGGRTYLAAQAILGLQVWDVTDPLDIELVAHLDLPLIDGGNYAGAWWVFWQAPWIYVAGRAGGLYVVDATDPAAPFLASHLPTGELGGLGPAIVYAVGNLLLVTGNPNGRMLTMDASDPIAPTVIDCLQGRRGYSHTFAAGALLNAGGQGDPEKLYVYPIDSQGGISVGPEIGEGLGDGGYGSYQDGLFHAGFSDHYAVFDLEGEELLGTSSGGYPDSDEDFAIVLGNLVFVGNDHEGRSALVPHRAEPDTEGPRVDWVHPADGADGVALTARIGVTLSDSVELDSLSKATFAVRALGGAALSGKYSAQLGIANFAPDEPLEPETTYEVVVDGVRDWAGNAGPSFQSTFRTGPAPTPEATAPQCEVHPFGPALVGAPVDFDVDLVNGAEVDSWTWEFGDGSPETAPSPHPSATHVYDEPGRYTVILRASNAHGTTSCAAVQIVHHPVLPVAPVASSSIVHTGDFAVNVNPDNGTVGAILGTDSSKAWEAPAGSRPVSLAEAPDGTLWVVDEEGAAIERLAGEDGAPIETFALPRGSRPQAILFPPGEDEPLVTLEGAGQLVRLASDGTIAATLDVGPTPRGLAVSGDGARVLVTQFVSTGGVGRVREVDPVAFEVVRTIELAVDPGPDTEASGRGVPNYVAGVALSPDGMLGLVPSKKDNVERGLFRDGLPLDFQSTVRSIVSRFELGAGAEDLAARVDLDDRSLPQSVLFSPLGDLFFVASIGSDTVDVYDAWKGELLAELTTGRAPSGLAINDIATKLYVHDQLSRTVSVFDIRDLLKGVANAAPLLVQRSVVASEALTPDVLAGKRLFYDATDPRLSRDSYLCCAACHLDGGHDGAVWDFTQLGEGLRNTIDLRGRAGLGHGRLHWTANFDEVQDFEHAIRDLAGGTGLLDADDFAATADPLGAPKTGLDSDLDRLAAYVASLDAAPASPHRDPDGSLTGEAELGEVLFATAGCGGCHAGPELTDGLRHDVGTLDPSSGSGSGQPLAGVGIETPTLRGLWSGGPWLHRGQATSLDEVLLSPAHGAGAGLSAEERAQLVAYLLQLE